MELGTEISQKLKKTIKKQLQTLGSYVDDELPEYIMVMIANKRTKEQMVEDLHLFLNDEAGKFVNWLLGVLEKIQKAIQLTSLDDLGSKSASESESVSEDEIIVKNQKKKDSKTEMKKDEKRKFTEKKDGKEKERHKSVDEKKRHSRSKSQDRERSVSRSKDKRRSRSRSNGRRRSRSRSKDRRHSRSRSKDGRRSRSRSKNRRRSKSRSTGRKPSLHSSSRDRRRSKSRDRNRSRERERRRSHSKEHRHSIDKTSRRGRSVSPKVRTDTKDNEGPKRLSGSDDESKQLKLSKTDANPMDFVKRIANNINAKLAGRQVLGDVEVVKGKVVVDSSEISVEKSKLKPCDDLITTDVAIEATVSSRDNVSLQAVGQYDDGGEHNDKTVKSSIDKKEIEDDQSNKKRERKLSRRSRSRSRSKTRRRSRRSRSRSPPVRRGSDDRRRRRSRSLTRRRDVRYSPSRDRRNDRRKSRDEPRRDVKAKDRRSLERIKTDVKSKEPVEKHEKEPEKEKLASQVIDSKRKPLLAPAALLKRAVNDAVSATKSAEKDNEELEEAEELDYTDDVEVDALHIGQESLDPALDRRVINFSQQSSGLATITINFQSPNQSENDDDDDDDEGGDNRGEDDDDVALRKGLLQDMSKVDARYAIMKSRLEQGGDKKATRRKERPTSEKTTDERRRRSPPVKQKPRFMGSMIADMEENTTNAMKRRQKFERRQDRKRVIESVRQTRTGRGRRRRGKGRESSGDEEVLSEEQVQRLTDESRRMKVQELTRTMTSAREGDLRSLLEGKRQQRDSRAAPTVKESASEDEETVERKLREKIKEEKHMRLFGKLKRGDSDRLHREREELRSKLDKARHKKKSERRSEKKKTASGNTNSDKQTGQKQEEQDGRESSGSEQWVESGAVKEADALGDDGKDDNGHVSDWDEAPTQGGRSFILEEEDAARKPVDREETDDENVEDEERKQVEDVELEISNDVLLASVHKETTTGSKHHRSEENECKTAETSMDVVGDEEKSEPKRKKIRQEFIVTLDGFEDSKQPKTEESNKHKTDNLAPKRSRRQQSHEPKNTKDELDNSFTQSDEEFEEILRKKQKEEDEKRDKKVHAATTRHHSSRRSRRSHRSRKSRSRSPDSAERDDIDREILIAEKKLQAQKLLKKSLDQVQSLNTENFSFEKKPKTAFLNPHFKPKVDIPIMNVLPLNIAGQPIMTPQTIRSAPPTIIMPAHPAQPLVMLQHQSNVVSLTTTRSSIPSTATETSLSINLTTANQQQHTETTTPTSEVTSPTNVDSTTTLVSSVGQPQTSLPSNKPCKAFPNCSFGERCLYLHPVCKFGKSCTNVHCIFSHNNLTTTSTSTSSLTGTLCKFYPNCMNQSCPFKHPVQKACRFGANCTNSDCLFTHEASTANKKWVAAKPHISERKYAVDNGVVANPVSIVTKSASET